MPDPNAPKPRRTRFVDGDAELEAMAAIADALRPLQDADTEEEEGALDRVIDWMISRYAPTWAAELHRARIEGAVEARMRDARRNPDPAGVGG